MLLFILWECHTIYFEHIPSPPPTPPRSSLINCFQSGVFVVHGTAFHASRFHESIWCAWNTSPSPISSPTYTLTPSSSLGSLGCFSFTFQTHRHTRFYSMLLCMCVCTFTRVCLGTRAHVYMQREDKDKAWLVLQMLSTLVFWDRVSHCPGVSRLG